ncbi:flagellar hook-associated protein FlgK [Alphaproteobacteria bacterium GH1-50]|uniref:Flagellar hook-associated protein 1 n=1 Tax=Kangsaoukella pontilimi TaxID=2691042 RepID=A0A7C9MJZ9_9RHOB|nr:flagellar hook-associated protein FlgK [Kangsaoukella pontilimi]MXQ08155.1 flagellar hook-associated protein FlgK [Kangsaoukella pontilimi]
MSISSALANALSGLTASSRAAQLVSSNVANAMTEGYGRRELELSARTTTGAGDGVQIDGIRRSVDAILLRDRRLADAGLANADVFVGFFQRALETIGRPGEAGSLTDVLTTFENALSLAASRPDNVARLDTAVGAARDLAGKLNDASKSVQQQREDADAAIATQVRTVNANLQRVADLNDAILRARGSGQDYPALLDQRQVIVDEISRVLPVSIIARDNDTIALYTPGGARLVDLTAAELGFDQTQPITPDMSLASGALSGLTIDGRLVNTAGASSPIAGGSLAALFDLRDARAPEVQARLDGFAAELLTRFEANTDDPTRAPGDPGLFTDGGGVYDAADLIGLAGRLSVNTALDPDAGGESWRLRDGLGAALPGDVGDATLISSLSATLSAVQAPADPVFGGAGRTVSILAADLLSSVSRESLAADGERSFQAARQETLLNRELSGGVDTDQEMQKLLMIEQAYAANAQVVRTASRLIDQLLEL